jgi:hypothetical protein
MFLLHTNYFLIVLAILALLFWLAPETISFGVFSLIKSASKFDRFNALKEITLLSQLKLYRHLCLNPVSTFPLEIAPFE